MNYPEEYNQDTLFINPESPLYTLSDWDLITYHLSKHPSLCSHLDGLIKYVIDDMPNKKTTLRIGEKLFRARIVKDKDNREVFGRTITADEFYGYPSDKCLAPKDEQVVEPGRVNDIGKAVLYTADNEYTAFAEMRPYKYQNVSIAELELQKDVDIFEFKYLEQNFKPDSVEQIYNHIAFNFFIPVRTPFDNTYKVTQYVASKIKELGFGGIRYSSSLSDLGMNTVFFDTGIAKANKSFLIHSNNILYFGRRIAPAPSCRLLPKIIDDNFTLEETKEFLDKINRKSK